MSSGTPAPLIRRSPILIFGPPAAALLCLAVVELFGLDQPLFSWFNHLSSWTGATLWANATILGDGLVCVVLMLLWVRDYPERVWGGLLGAIFMTVVLHLFKDLLGLPRPLAVLPEEWVTVIGPPLRRGSFPSGHTSTMALFAGIWALTSSRRWVAVPALSLAVLVGVSRMAVGVHWPSDVLAGIALGWTSAWVGLKVAPRTPWGMDRNARWILGIALLISGVVLLTVYDSGYPGTWVLQRSLAAICLARGVTGFLTLRR